MKHILLVGGSTGIGKALAEELLQKGHKVTMASRNRPAIDHSQFNHLTFDVLTSDASELSNVGALDGFSYLPGSIALKPLQMLKEEQFKSDMEINFFGLVRCVKSISSQLGEGASLVFFSSVAAQLGMPFHSSIAAAKAAVEGFTKSLAAESAPKWRVNCIAPSLTDTPLASRLLNNDKKREMIEEKHPLKKIGKATDLAKLALFLLSDDSSWITGQVIGNDGGKSTLSI